MFGRGQSISDYYRAIWEDIQNRVLKEQDDFIIGTSAEELAEYYLSQNALSNIEIDPDREENIDYRKEMRVVPAHQRERGYANEGDKEFEFESIVLTIPIIPNEHLSLLQQLETNTRSLSWSTRDFRFGNDTISYSIDIKGYGYKHSDEQVQKNIEQIRGQIYQWLQWVQQDIEKENANLQQLIKPFVEQRKAKIGADEERINSLVSKIKIPLKKKESEATKRIKVDPKPLVKRVRPKPNVPEDYVLDRNKVLDIIEIIDNQGRQFEKTPNTFKDSEEEDLRNTILVGLNTVFSDKATGETFSSKGKTDIYLSIEKGNILICECKIWGGQKLYHKTIDQLLGYLTWRNNYGIMITFVRNKNLSKILEETEDNVTSHTSYSMGFKKLADTHFMSHHKLPQDEYKDVEIHHLFYNLYTD